MNLKRYRVNNIQEALSQIKKDLGPDAIIVSTRQVKDAGGAFGLFGKSMLEVTAARDEKKAAATAVKSNPKPGLVSGYGPINQGLPARQHENTPAAPPQLTGSNRPRQDDTQKLILPLKQEIQELKEMIQGLEGRPKQDQRAVMELKQEVSEMRHLIHSLAAQSGQLRKEDLAENLVVLYQQMVFNGMEEKFARRLVQEAQKSILPNEMQNFSYVKIFVARMLMKILKVTGGLKINPNQQKIISLLGPTGVGKTTTVAKIASMETLKYKRKVAMITIDTFRIGAVEQLKAYAKIMNLPLRVVTGKAELNQTIASLSEYDVILIDTGGRSQRDESQMYELRELFDERGRIENQLVLSATTKDSELNEITRKFGDIPLSSIVFTKLDECTTYGCMFNHSIRFKKPLSFLTTGQKVPEDIEPASKERLVDLLLNISGN